MTDKFDIPDEHPYHKEGGELIFNPPKTIEQIDQERRIAQQEARLVQEHQMQLEQTKTNSSIASSTTAQAIFSGLLFLATVISFGFSIQQLRLAKKSADASTLAAKQAEAAVKVAQDTLKETVANNKGNSDFSNKSLDAMIANYQGENRAWLEVCGTSLESAPMTTNIPPTLLLHLCNVGRTPAKSIKEWHSAAVGLSADIYPEDQLPQKPIVRGMASVPPGGRVTGQMDFKLDGAQTRQLVNGETEYERLYTTVKNRLNTLFYLGTITYKDDYGHEHTTEFCIILKNMDTGQLAFCQNHNELN